MTLGYLGSIQKRGYTGNVQLPSPLAPPRSPLGLAPDSGVLRLYVRTWNLPALVMYLMPLKGLYFSPYMSSRFTFSPVEAQRRYFPTAGRVSPHSAPARSWKRTLEET